MGGKAGAVLVFSVLGEAGEVKLGAGEVVEVVGAGGGSWFPAVSGASVVKDRVVVIVGAAEGRLAPCGVVMLVVVAVGALFVVKWGLMVGAGVGGGAAGGGGWMKLRLSEGSGSEALTRL